MSTASKLVPWLILLAPFLILAYFYNSLTNQVLIARDFFGDGAIVAPKSLFTVFRVSLIEVVCGALVEIMRRPSARASSKTEIYYYRFWTVLLYTVALKSLLQTLETVWTASSTWIYYLTFASVVVGILLAAISGRKAFSDLRSLRGKYRRFEILALAGLLITYLGLAFIPVFVFG